MMKKGLAIAPDTSGPESAGRDGHMIELERFVLTVRCRHMAGRGRVQQAAWAIAKMDQSCERTKAQARGPVWHDMKTSPGIA